MKHSSLVSVAVLTNSHKLGGVLEASSLKSVSLNWSQHVGRARWRFQEENSFLCPFQLLVAACIPWFVTSFSIFEAYYSSLCFPHHLAFPLSVVKSPFASLSEHCDYIWFTWIIQDNLSHLKIFFLIISAKPLWLYKVTFTCSGD